MRSLPVPPRSFRAWRWWEPVRPGVRWFYGSRRAPAPYGSSRVLLDTVDDPLRPLVEAAQARGWGTLPSCAGHAVTPEGAMAAWGAVVGDAEQVRREGLVLQDTETGRRVRWQDPAFRAPSFAAFGHALRDTHNRGVFGVVWLEPEERSRLARAARHEGFAVEAVGEIGLQLHLHAPTEGMRARAWRAMLPHLRESP